MLVAQVGIELYAILRLQPWELPVLSVSCPGSFKMSCDPLTQLSSATAVWSKVLLCAKTPKHTALAAGRWLQKGDCERGPRHQGTVEWLHPPANC